MTGWRSVIVGLVGILCLGSCSDIGRTQDSEASPIAIELVRRLGDLSGSASFSDVLSVVVGPNGLLYVTQWQDPAIEVVSSDGTPRRTIGGGGLGPGEFIQPVFLGIIGDTLWVAGSPNDLVLFSLDGALLRDATIRLPTGTAPRSFAYMGESRVLVEASRGAAEGADAGTSILSMAIDGGGADTIATVGADASLLSLNLESLPSPASMTIPEFGSAPFAYSGSGDGVIVLDHGSDGARGWVRASWIDRRGDTVAVRERTYRREPFSSQVREAILARLAAIPFPGLTPARIREEANRQIDWPNFVPAFTSVVFGADGRLWLRRTEEDDSARWEVWSPTHDRIEEVWLPAGFELHYADPPQLWGETAGLFDVPILAHYQVVED